MPPRDAQAVIELFEAARENMEAVSDRLTSYQAARAPMPPPAPPHANQPRPKPLRRLWLWLLET